MAAVTTERLVALAYELAGWDELPPDWMVYQPGTRISHILFGLEVGPADLFMARQLGYHAVVSYEPVGYSGPSGSHMAQRVKRMEAVGIPHDKAMEVCAASARARVIAEQSRNYDHAPSVARLLEIPFVTVYEPLAELGRSVMQERIDQRLGQLSAHTLADVRDAVMTLPSFTKARAAPHPVIGGWTSPAGRVVVDHARDPLTPDEVFAYFSHGIDTLCAVEAPSSDALALVRERDAGNVISLGRIAGESAGALPYIERLRAEGIEVTAFAGVLGA